jgi:hypothetical protein
MSWDGKDGYKQPVEGSWPRRRLVSYCDAATPAGEPRQSKPLALGTNLLGLMCWLHMCLSLCDEVDARLMVGLSPARADG